MTISCNPSRLDRQRAGFGVVHIRGGKSGAAVWCLSAWPGQSVRRRSVVAGRTASDRLSMCPDVPRRAALCCVLCVLCAVCCVLCCADVCEQPRVEVSAALRRDKGRLRTAGEERPISTHSAAPSSPCTDETAPWRKVPVFRPCPDSCSENIPSRPARFRSSGDNSNGLDMFGITLYPREEFPICVQLVGRLSHQL